MQFNLTGIHGLAYKEVESLKALAGKVNVLIMMYIICDQSQLCLSSFPSIILLSKCLRPLLRIPRAVLSQASDVIKPGDRLFAAVAT